MNDLRKQFYKIMGEIAEKDPSVILLTGDLGFSFYEEYADKFPRQFINCGCIEQAMMGIAAGMALGGMKPYVYSGAIFALMRPYEQIRDDIAFQNRNVKIIGTGASQFLGKTHNLQEGESEANLLTPIGMKQFYPKNEDELREALSSDGPAYIRL